MKRKKLDSALQGYLATEHLKSCRDKVGAGAFRAHRSFYPLIGTVTILLYFFTLVLIINLRVLSSALTLGQLDLVILASCYVYNIP